MQLTRESSSTAWMVTTSNHLYVSTDGGHAWTPVPLPALLTYHPKWAQGLKVTSSRPHTLTLLAWVLALTLFVITSANSAVIRSGVFY